MGMESMLGSTFYFDTASVMGSGKVTLETPPEIDGTVPVNVDIFQVDFSFKFTNGPDGAELTNEETKELLQSMNEHNAAIESNKSSASEEDDNDMSMSLGSDETEESKNEEEGKDEL